MPHEPLHQEKELFQRLSQGDEQAFAEIFYHYTAIILPFVKSKVHSEDIAEEIVQDVFLKLWTHRAVLRDLEEPALYLRRMVTNRTLDHLRHQALEQQYARHNQNEHEGAPGDSITYREAKKLLDEAIQALPQQRRLVYQLQQDGYSYQEIADQLQLSIHTVRNQLTQAYRSIRDHLRSYGLSLFILLILQGR